MILPMLGQPPFKEFQKMPRLFREMIITEKLDGTNAQISIQPIPSGFVDAWPILDIWDTEGGVILALYAGSRNRYITPDNDNYGFAKWVLAHREEIRELGIGTHFGEWWGKGIQRGYGKAERSFSLFNTSKHWDIKSRTTCLDVVPTLYEGPFDTGTVSDVLAELGRNGSKASPGFMRPEGVAVYHLALNKCFKVTVENDSKPKGKVEEFNASC